MSMPLIGFGTWVDLESGQKPYIMGPVSLTALEVGYKHFDMAYNYQTEQFVLGSILDSGISREQIFLTNKSSNAPELDEVKSHLFQIGYYNLFLLHHPPFTTGKEFEEDILREWTQMNKLLNSGLVRAIGVSNFYHHQIQILLNLCEKFDLIKPCVNQIELHPFNQNWNLVSFCQQNGIQIVAHTPLGGLASGYVLQSDIIRQIAQEIGATPGQVVLASTMKIGIGAIPRSLNKDRMIENLNSVNFISKITQEYLDRLRQLDIGVPMVILANAAFEMDAHV
ncbi:aldo/keto reductase [soil metagenome]